jgi:transposase
VPEIPPGRKSWPNSAEPGQRRRAGVLAYFDHHTSNEPAEATNERLEALRHNALGVRKLTHYRIRSPGIPSPQHVSSF